MPFCIACGAEIPAGARFCPKCGKPVVDGDYFSRECGPWMGWHAWRNDFWAPGWWGMDWWSPERWEGWAERWRWAWSPAWIMVNAVLAGLFIVFLGFLLLVTASGISPLFSGDSFWPWLAIGIGALLIVRAYARLKVAGRMIWYGGIVSGVILIATGLTGLAMIAAGLAQYLWLLVFIVIGLLVIAVGIANYLLMKSWNAVKK